MEIACFGCVVFPPAGTPEGAPFLKDWYGSNGESLIIFRAKLSQSAGMVRGMLCTFPDFWRGAGQKCPPVSPSSSTWVITLDGQVSTPDKERWHVATTLSSG